MVAIYAGDNGIKAVQLITKNIIDTDLGKASLCPRVRHNRVEASNLSKSDAREMGREIALISNLNYGRSREWNPFHRLTHRIEITDFPKDIVSKIKEVIEIASARIPIGLLDSQKFLFAHSDTHIGNMLFNENGLNIIDFDSANWYPVGWDISFLYNHLALENNNLVAFNELRESYLDAGGLLSENQDILSLIKALVSTTYALTLQAKPERVEALRLRLKVLESWANSLDSPEVLPTFRYLD